MGWIVDLKPVWRWSRLDCLRETVLPESESFALELAPDVDATGIVEGVEGPSSSDERDDTRFDVDFDREGNPGPILLGEALDA